MHKSPEARISIGLLKPPDQDYCFSHGSIKHICIPHAISSIQRVLNSKDEMMSQGTYRAKIPTRLTPQIAVWHSPRSKIRLLCMDWSRLGSLAALGSRVLCQ